MYAPQPMEVAFGIPRDVGEMDSSAWVERGDVLSHGGPTANSQGLLASGLAKTFEAKVDYPTI